MAATVVVNWTPVNGGHYEIWYATLSVVGTSSLPPTTGWTQATGSPFDSALGTATISGLDDNTQYRVVSRADCTGVDSGWVNHTLDKLVCPTLSVVANPVPGDAVGASITTTVTISNYIEFETIATSITLTIRKASDSSVVATKVYTTPYDTALIVNTFSNLLTGTGYTVYLTIHNNIEDTDIACSNQSVTTLTPVVVPPPTCAPTTFTVTNVTASSFTINITGFIATGDTFDVSINSGATYPYTGFTSAVITISGLSAANSYTIVLRRNCAGGGQGYTPSQTITTNASIIVGTVAMNSSANLKGHFSTADLYLTFTFPQPTTSIITLYFGFTFESSCNPCAGFVCYSSNGYDIFTPLPGRANGLCSGSPTGYSEYGGGAGGAHYPFIVTIPAGVTTYNSGTNIRSINPSPSSIPAANLPWANIGTGTQPAARGYVDLFVKVNTPLGHSAAFTIAPGLNINTPTLHNV